jgi:hypothetical protein
MKRTSRRQTYRAGAPFGSGCERQLHQPRSILTPGKYPAPLLSPKASFNVKFQGPG